MSEQERKAKALAYSGIAPHVWSRLEPAGCGVLKGTGTKVSLRAPKPETGAPEPKLAADPADPFAGRPAEQAQPKRVKKTAKTAKPKS